MSPASAAAEFNDSHFFLAAEQLLNGESISLRGRRLCADTAAGVVLAEDGCGHVSVAARGADCKGCVEAVRWAIAQPVDPIGLTS